MTAAHSRIRLPGLPRLLAVLVTLASAASIVATYSVFSQTTDEPAHVAAGMEWLAHGRYTYEPLHPPVARVFAALGPFLAGVRGHDLPNMWDAGNDILLSGSSYVHTLALARAGILPFFLLAAWVVWWWARRLHGEWPAAAAVVLFATTPTVLAHAGLATTDLPVTATMALALAVGMRWLERPTRGWSVLLGLTAALAVCSKFTAIPFLGATLLLVLVARRAATGTWIIAPAEQPGALPVRSAIEIAVAVTLVGIWAVYRFAIGPINPSLPFSFAAPEFFHGIHQVASQNADGNPNFLLGHISERGWWYYFPTALAVKTPLPLLFLAGVGAVAAVRAFRRDGSWPPAVPILGILGILCVTAPAHMNIGVRHVLPAYPLLAIAAAGGVKLLVGRLGAVPVLVRRAGSVRAVALGIASAGVLLLAQAATTAAAFPDYLPYFNPIAGRHPENVLLDSNLDWGQDLFRLARVLDRRGIDTVGIVYYGSARLAALGIPHAVRLGNSRSIPTGWIVAGEDQLHGLRTDRFLWLNDATHVERVGKSLWLLRVTAADTSRLARVRAATSKPLGRATAASTGKPT